MKLVIAEKPSVAMSIAKVLGVRNKKEGYTTGNGYIISWCVGHLIQMANPDQYDEKYLKWELDNLPILPSAFKYEVSKYTKKQYQVLKKLLNDKNIVEVINACDAGREGELIFRLVYHQAKSNLKIKRLWISSLEDSAIQEGFNYLKDGKDYDDLYSSALARAKADWLIGINMSRLYSLLYNQNYSVGRVQTPVLNMIVKRDEEIGLFKKEKYYVGQLDLGDFLLTTDRIDNIDIAEDLVFHTVGTKIQITDVINKKKVTKPDLLYDLTTLQREANKYFGMSAKETLDIAQSLYEKKLITYPRTDSRYLSEDMVVPTINTIFGKYDFDTSRIKVIFNTSKLTDHHAILPTSIIDGKDLSKLSENEKQIYQLIVNKTHASVGYPLIENTTKIVCTIENQKDKFEFNVSGNVIVEEGFTKYLKEYKKNGQKEDLSFPDVKIGDTFDIRNRKVLEKFTNPPKHYTDVIHFESRQWKYSKCKGAG
ncbi:DNA topoisomerase [Clostridium perfringens]